jgi:hypothetical protein
MNNCLWCIPLVAASLAAQAGEVYVGAGTTGIVVGVGGQVGPRAGVRLEGNFLDYSRTVSTSNVDYDGKLKSSAGSLLVDFFPVSGGCFRITAGAVVGDGKVTAVGRPRNNTLNINGQVVNATGESINFTVKQPSVQPYLGIGVGHALKTGFGFFADLGATYGKPRVDFSATPGLVAAAGQANIDAERQDVQNKADNYKFYPVVKLGISYRF